MNQRASIMVLFATMVIYVFGIGVMLPVIPLLVKELSGDAVGKAATLYGALLSLYALMQFLFGPAFGALSDRFGRRPIMLVSLAGLGVDYILLAVAPNLWIVALARIIGGIMGASVATATAYIADITPPEKRAANFGLIGAAFGVGFIAGPLVGGVLGEFGSRVPFYAAAGVSLIAFLFAFFMLPESLDAAHRRPFRLKEANPIGAFMVVLRYKAVLALLSLFVIAQLAERMLEANWVLYTSYRFGWTAAQVGISLALVGVLVVITQGGLVRVVVPKIGERVTINIGFAVAATCMVGIAFASQAWMIYVIIVPYVLGWGLTAPAVQSLITREVPPNEQGILQGAISSAQTVTGIIGPPVAGSVFGYFIGPVTPFHLPGAAFLLGAFLFVIGLIVALWGVHAPPPATGSD
jgi:MFS transporter, DHA1 family, tetracycline resistance protein